MRQKINFMKKTLTVNLNNIVFHIDDDAYEMLQTYLSEIADHFQSDDEKKEIMNDIEARIAELFTEKLQKNKNVVNLVDVQEIIEIMGKPSQYADEDEKTEAPKSDNKKQHKSRRFYRDPENAILGGIGGGFAAYFGLDITLVRILLVVLVLFGAGFLIIPVYIVMWFVAPQALTASQRLEMQGEDVTIDSIKTELNNAKTYVESDKFKKNAGTVGERIIEIMRVFFKVIFGIVGAVLGMVGIILVAALIFLLFFLIFEPTVFNSFVPGVLSNWLFFTPENAVLTFISLILVIGCPIFMLIYWFIHVFSGRHNTSRTASLVVLILWLAGLFMFYSVSAKSFVNMKQHNIHPMAMHWRNHDDKSLSDEVRNCEPFQSIDVWGDIEVILKQDSVQEVKVSTESDNLSQVITEVKNGVLKIHTEDIFFDQTTKVYVSAASIQRVEAKGACSIKTESQLNVPKFSLELVGASNADLDIIVAGLCKVKAIGASEVTLKGTSQELKIHGVGASTVEAKELIAKNVEVDVTGASNAKVNASESIDAKANGASEIECKGNPKIRKQSDHLGSTISIE